MTVQCCCCGQVRDASGKWDKAEAAPQGAVSHSYCGTCVSELKARLKAYAPVMLGASLTGLVVA